MKKLLLFATSLLLTMSSWAAPPDAPLLGILQQQESVRITWSESSGATGYKLLYLPYGAGIEQLGSMDMGTSLNFQVTVPSRLQFYIAVVAYNADGDSAYSNIGGINIAALPNSGANRIVVLLNRDYGSYNLGIRQGLLHDLQHTADATQNRHVLSNGYVVEFVDFDPAANPLPALSQAKDVLAILCDSSTDCDDALNSDSATDVLVISLTATSNLLANGANILRMAPSNTLQAKAIYNAIKRDNRQSMSIVYEPDSFAMDLYSALLSEYFLDLVLDRPHPQLSAVLSFTEFANLQANQKGMSSRQVLDSLRQESSEAVIYMGFYKGFSALVDRSKGGDPTVAKSWYAADGIYVGETIPSFATLKGFGLYYPEVAGVTDNYYARDAGKFLRQALATYKPLGSAERSQFLSHAQTVRIPAYETDTRQAKGFGTADQSGAFTMYIYDDAGGVAKEESYVTGNQ